MNPLTVVLSGLLLASAVAGGSTNAVRSRYPYTSSSDSSEENTRYYGSLPSTFDARDQWSRCPSVAVVPNQECCDSSYALVPTAVMTDRTCILSNSTSSTPSFSYSAFDVLTCCAECAVTAKNACRGGDPVAVWKYWNKVGITTDECLPYAYTTTCTHVECPSRCSPGVNGTVAGYKKKGLEYYVVPPTEEQIQAEILYNGPVEASFDMYVDFANFKGDGVYIYRYGPFLNKHSVKIIGWGTCGNTPYWLVVNTFGESWGNYGVGKFMRGQKQLNFETNVRAAKPNF